MAETSPEDDVLPIHVAACDQHGVCSAGKVGPGEAPHLRLLPPGVGPGRGTQGFRPRSRSLPSVASRPELEPHISRMCGKDRRASLAVIIDYCTREIFGRRSLGNGSRKTAEAVLEEVPGYRFGLLDRVHQPLVLRSGNGLKQGIITLLASNVCFI